MKNQIKELIATTADKLIKVQLDSKTWIYIKSMESLNVWLPKYPNATVVTN